MTKIVVISEDRLSDMERKIDSMERLIEKMADRVMEWDKPMSRKDAAEYLGMSERNLTRKMKTSEITFCQDGSRPKFLKEDLDRYLKNKRVQLAQQR